MLHAAPPDMFPLTRQVQVATDTAKGAGARLAGMPVPSFPDEEKTFDELQARITKTIDFLRPDEGAVRGCRNPHHQPQGGPRRFNFIGAAFLETWAKPNFFFHTPWPMPSCGTMALNSARLISLPVVSEEAWGGQRTIERGSSMRKFAASVLAVSWSPRPRRQSGVKIGVLTCDVSGSVGLILGGSKNASCVFQGSHGAENYKGQIVKVGLDIGVTGGAVMSWVVLPPAR